MESRGFQDVGWTLNWTKKRTDRRCNTRRC